MAIILRHFRGLALVTCLLGVAALWQGYLAYRASGFNAALEREDMETAASHGVDEARVAEALVLQARGDWQAALEIYGEIERNAEHRLRQTARFNMANVYLRRGIEMASEGSMDVALPLLELAKSAYRRVLRDEPGDWDARYNLAKALQVLPDLEIEDVEEDIMPERSQRSLVPVESRRELP